MTKFEQDRQELIENLDYLKSLKSKEYTLRKKWDELQNKLFLDRVHVHSCRDRLWRPMVGTFKTNDAGEVIEETNFTVEQMVSQVKPKICICNSKAENKEWELLRTFGSTAEYNGGGWRKIRFIVRVGDGTMFSVLGIGELSSDVSSIESRDKWIGWSSENKFKQNKLNHTAILSTCVPTQPFGGYFRGGKLIAALATTEVIRNQWKLQYDETLAGITTTSLYGKPSMYNGIPWWKPLSNTSGAMPIMPDDKIYEKWVKKVKAKYPAKYKEALKHTSPTLGIVALIGKLAEIDFANDYNNNHERGVYFSEVYENTRPFLRGEIKESELKMKDKFATATTESILEWWRQEAIEGYNKQVADGKLNDDHLFYNHGYLEAWDVFKKKYKNSL